MSREGGHFLSFISLRLFHSFDSKSCPGSMTLTNQTVHASYFASTTQPDTQSDIWARWPAKPPCHLFSFNIQTTGQLLFKEN